MRNYFKNISAVLFFILIVYGAYWMVQLIWFKPNNPSYFYQRFLIEYGLQNPEWLTDIEAPYIGQLEAYNARFSPLTPNAFKQKHILINESKEILKQYNKNREEQNVGLNAQFELWLKSEEGSIPKASPYYPLHPYHDLLDEYLELLIYYQTLDTKEEGRAFINRLRLLDDRINEINDLYSNDVQSSYFLSLPSIQQRLSSLKQFVAYAPDEHVLYRSFAAKAIRADPVLLNNSDASDQLRSIAGIIQNELYPAVNKLILSLEKSVELQASDQQVSISDERIQVSASSFMHEDLNADSLLQAIEDELSTLKTQREAYEEFMLQNELEVEITRFAADDSGYFSALSSMRSLSETWKEQIAGLFPQVTIPDLEIRLSPEGLHAPQTVVYVPPSLSGRRKATLFISRKGIAQTDASKLLLLIGREGILGKHLFCAVRRLESNLPVLHKGMRIPAMNNGWSYYSLDKIDQKLALFDNKPVFKLAYFDMKKLLLIRAGIELGLGWKQWSEEDVTAWLVKEDASLNEKVASWLRENEVKPSAHLNSYLAFRSFVKAEFQAQNESAQNFLLQDFLVESLNAPVYMH